MSLIKLHHCTRRGGMSTHRQQQQSDQEKKRTWFSRRNVVIATIAIVALLITTAWILSILNVIPATWATIATAVLTVATAVFTFIPAFPSLFGFEKPEQHTQDDTTAVVLTGIGGAGKSTLAALVSQHAEKQRIVGKGPFAAEALWLRVDAAAEIGM